MNANYEQEGHGIARDGRRFDPPIPAGATVSWKRLREPAYLPEQDRTATHVLAVWDRLDEMEPDSQHFRDTARGPCVAFYADAESIEDLVESAVPAPVWADPTVPSEVVITDCVAEAFRQYSLAIGMKRRLSPVDETRWLRTAVWTYRMLFDSWPILNVHIPPHVDEDDLPADAIRGETARLFDLVESELNQQLTTRWWEHRHPGLG